MSCLEQASQTHMCLHGMRTISRGASIHTTHMLPVSLYSVASKLLCREIKTIISSLGLLSNEAKKITYNIGLGCRGTD